MESLLDDACSEIDVGEPPKKRQGRRLRLVAAGAVIVPVVAVAATWALFFTPESPAELRPSTQGATSLDVATGVWSVGQGSVAGYRVREKLLRLPASNDGVGRTSAVTGAFHLSGDRHSLRVDKGMRIDVDVSRLKSDEDRRDDHMRTMAIETDLFPTATFVTTSDIVLPADVTAAGRAVVNVAGDLTIHGVTLVVSVPLQAQYVGGRIEVVGAVSFPWDYFGKKRPNLSYVTVEADPNTRVPGLLRLSGSGVGRAREDRPGLTSAGGAATSPSAPSGHPDPYNRR